MKNTFLLPLVMILFMTKIEAQNMAVNPSLEEFMGKGCGGFFNSAGHDNYKDLSDSFPGWNYFTYGLTKSMNCPDEGQYSFHKYDAYGDIDTPISLVKNGSGYHGGYAINYYMDLSSYGVLYPPFYIPEYRKKYLDQGGYASASIGSISNPLDTNRKYFFSVWISPCYNHSIYKSNVSRFCMATSDFGLSLLTENSFQNKTKRFDQNATDIEANTFPLMSINEETNIIQTNADSDWVEMRFIFTSDSNYQFYAFGIFPQSLGRARTLEPLSLLDYSNPEATKMSSNYFISYFADAFTLMPYPELGDTLYLCGDSLVLNPTTPDNDLTWWDGSKTKTKAVYKPGKYWVTASSQFSSVTDSVIVIDERVPLWKKDSTLCTNQNRVLEIPKQAIDILWNTGDTVSKISVYKSGAYSVEFTMPGGHCKMKRETSVTIDSVLISPIADTVFCENTTLTIPNTVVHADDFQWSTGANTASITIDQSGNYWLAAQTLFCKDTAFFKVEKEPIADALLEITEICEGKTARFQPDIPWKYHWQEMDDSVLTPLVSGVYVLEWQQNACGLCYDTLHFTIKNCLCEAWVPNAFTPNNDGLNDTLLPIIPCGTITYQFQIYNRWGELVFDTDNSAQAWKGENAGTDAFLWILSYRAEETMQWHFQHGYVQVLK